MRQRLRNPLPADEYQAVRDNFIWPDHVLRLLVTAGAVAWLNPQSVADPACGDASIVTHADRLRSIRRVFLGDLSKRQITLLGRASPANYVLRSGDVFDNLAAWPIVDVTVLTEILEHIEDPDGLLRLAHERSRNLVASSPLNEPADVGNHEHVWSWSKEAYETMLRDAGWTPWAYTEIAFPGSSYPYTYQLWVCR